MRYLLVAATFLLAGLVPAAASPPQDDCGTGADAPWGGPAPVVTYPLACEGTLAGDDFADYYFMDVPAGTDLRVTLAPGPGMTLSLAVDSWSADGRLYRGTYGEADATTEPLVVDVHRPTSGDRVRLFVYQRGIDGAYAMKVEPGVPAPPQDDCGSGRDAGRTPATAVALAVRTDCLARVHIGPDDGDLFTFHAEAGAGVALDLDWTSWCLDDPDGRRVHCSWWDWWPAQYHGIAGTSGTWTVDVEEPYSTHDYRILLKADGTVTRYAGLVPFSQRIVEPVEERRGPREEQGLEAQWVRLAHAVREGDVFHATATGGSDLFVSFHDDAGARLGWCWFGASPRWCSTAPVGATWMLVSGAHLFSGPIAFEIDHVTYGGA